MHGDLRRLNQLALEMAGGLKNPEAKFQLLGKSLSIRLTTDCIKWNSFRFSQELCAFRNIGKSVGPGHCSGKSFHVRDATDLSW